jgi:hypothetical protein
MGPPHFLCIGAHKSGTTWLYQNLRQHPAVWLPPIKELHYFDGMPGLSRLAQRLNEAIRDAVVADRIADPAKLDFMRRLVLDQRRDFAWYQSLFEPAGDRLSGDMTPAYAVLPAPTVRTIRERLPDCRVIFIMRNPIERAWSHFRSHVGKADTYPADSGFDAIRRHLDSPASQSRTAYMQTIETWEQSFPQARMLYLFYDDVLADPDAFLEKVCRFLGIQFQSSYFAGSRDAIFNRSVDLNMDARARAYLASKYHSEMAALHARFGGHASQWLAEAEVVLRGND